MGKCGNWIDMVAGRVARPEALRRASLNCLAIHHALRSASGRATQPVFQNLAASPFRLSFRLSYPVGLVAAIVLPITLPPELRLEEAEWLVSGNPERRSTKRSIKPMVPVTPHTIDDKTEWAASNGDNIATNGAPRISHAPTPTVEPKLPVRGL